MPGHVYVPLSHMTYVIYEYEISYELFCLYFDNVFYIF